MAAFFHLASENVIKNAGRSVKDGIFTKILSSLHIDFEVAGEN